MNMTLAEFTACGESAFPDPAPSEAGCTGMTLRDYFAAKAMPYCQSYIANPSITRDVAKDIAETAYIMADAMLVARETFPTPAPCTSQNPNNL